jgi:hypothetical protein
MIRKVYIKPFILFTLILMVFACNEYLGPVVDCSECFDYEPDTADLIIYVTLNDENPEVPIVLYRENVERNLVDWVDTVRESPYHLPSAVDQFYSVTAEYNVGGKKVVAIDGDKMKVKHVSESCDFECWIITGGYLKVELKYDD